MGSVTALAEPAVDLPVSIRPATTEELRFVQATWARGMRPSRVPAHRDLAEVRIGDFRASVDRDLWTRAHHLLVDSLLADSRVAVAVDPEIDDSPIGWAAWSGDTLHFVHVVPAARRCRVATKLVLHTQARHASHWTRAGHGLVRLLHGDHQTG